MELGLYTFAETTADPATDTVISAQERIANLMEEVELADQIGLDVFGIGEHHRPDFAASTPAVLLAAAAMRTKRIRLTSAVTVLSSDDPVRVFQEFSTVDLLSGGRAEILAGRGSFIESFPLFGYDLKDYDSLFAEKLDLLLKIREQTTLSWQGEHRASLDRQSIYPRPVQQPLPVWVGVGGNPQSVIRAGTLGLPMALAIIGGEPARFKPLVDLYREAARRAGHDPARLPVSINSHGYIGEDGDRAADEIFPYYVDVMGRIGRERGWPPLSRAQFEASRAPQGSDFVGDPSAVIDKILAEHELFRHQRFLIKFSMGSIPHAKMMKSIELFGTVVAPAVRKALAPVPA
ncbi:LLM class flavin-dependent oxidoreductase [Labrys neptuniae]|uniref:LLM class flavin-dependent oxidoreductase n=1 Tax=Labrys neptuniae TaxID=376174 RepID=UPI002890C0DA|nr:LLM class flavin-dependent oxidoreductase [Labrys neptuniae]MDT3382167.1 LLM class flavin-dependent oxidoreductase [Labrys neptuniae]